VPFDAWLLFFVTETLLSFSPGPAVLFVVAQGIAGGGRGGLAATCGVLGANALWFLASALGLGAVLVATPGLFAAVRWLGCAYVVWLGIAALRGGGPVGAQANTSANGDAAGAGADTAIAVPPFAAVARRGLWLQLSNPKALMFFGAILPGFVDPRGAWPPWLQVLVYAVTSIGTEFWVLLGYGLLAGAVRDRLRDPRYARAVDRAAGVLLLLVALWIALRPGG